MKKLCKLKDTLINLVEQQMTNPQCVDTHEMGEVIDMIKDLAETCYYVSIVEAMEDKEDHEESSSQTDTMYYGIGAMNDDNKKMGHSPMKRKSYIESKELHMDQARQMRELEDYAQVLTSDLLEMIQDATPEEKQLLQRKIATLATKIV